MAKAKKTLKKVGKSAAGNVKGGAAVVIKKR
jgi:hypothetical protein